MRVRIRVNFGCFVWVLDGRGWNEMPEEKKIGYVIQNKI